MLLQVGCEAQGIVVRDLTPEDIARLDFYEGGFGYDTQCRCRSRRLRVRCKRRSISRQADLWATGAEWSLPDWVARWGATVVATAGDFMALYGQRPAADVLKRYGPMLVRGSSRVRAAQTAPTTLRRKASDR